MKTRFASLALLFLALAVLPASAQVLYENGPINGDKDAWPFSAPYIVSDTFTLRSNSTVGGFDLAIWEYPGDKVLSVGWSISSSANGGTFYGSGTVSGNNLSDTFLSTNSYGFDIDEITATGLSVGLIGGTYWLNLGNATNSTGDPVYWDENSGAGSSREGCPSLAQEALIGTIPSETFAITGLAAGRLLNPAASCCLALASSVWLAY